MEIAAHRWQLAEQMRHVNETLRDEVSYFTLALPYTEHSKQRCAEHLLALLLQYFWPDDDIDVPGFIFNRNEDDALGRFRSLAHGDDATAARELTVPIGLQRSGRHQSVGKQLWTQQ